MADHSRGGVSGVNTIVDSEGIQRVASKYGFNAFSSVEDAARSARAYLRAGSAAEFWVWRLDDGTYDWTAIPNPRLRWFATAELVDHG